MGNVYEFNKANREMTAREKAEQERARQIQELSNVPVPWFKHPTNDKNLEQFRHEFGNEAYGRLWELAEILACTNSHAIPTPGERGYNGILRALSYETTDQGAEQFESLVSALADYDIATIDESGRRGIVYVDEAALAIAEKRYNGSIGGNAARYNRRRKALA